MSDPFDFRCKRLLCGVPLVDDVEYCSDQCRRRPGLCARVRAWLGLR